ncbi:FliM/FliN family flagellar motor switch protein [Arcobacter vandammei]|uniref:FliM/FliN family flagellar motor switch protein n=1 Tax=Arcobacter vandammei TaxID=2782243 RepID=UPI0018E02CDF|nr:FliM/FliN family flagellar motor switch protein [Arcobacter vandammei]
MASDLSNILKEELANTLEQLLGKKAKVDSVNPFEASKFEGEQVIFCESKFDFKNISSSIKFYIPTKSATNFEFLMLGGMGDLKDTLDDETLDALNEIVSNVCGSFCTVSNAQGFSDIGSVKFEIKDKNISDIANVSKQNSYEFGVDLDGSNYPIIVSFTDEISPYFSQITGATSKASLVEEEPKPKQIAPMIQASSSVHYVPKNLELLQSVKLKLSVRLGTKVVLLKDILRWDVGEIIELEQMVNEPLEVLVNGVKIGEGEAVIVEGKFGLKIKRIGNEELKLAQIGL